MRTKYHSHLPWNGERCQEVVNGDQSLSLLLKPFLSFVVLAIGTMPVTTRTTQMVSTTASFTMISKGSEFTGPATLDQAQDTSVPDWNRIAKVPEILGSMLPKAVCNRWHRALWKTKEVLDNLSAIDCCGIGQMEIEHSCLKRAMPQELLNSPYGHSGFEQMRCTGMSQRVR
jgi:hypothetical protein